MHDFTTATVSFLIPLFTISSYSHSTISKQATNYRKKKEKYKNSDDEEEKINK